MHQDELDELSDKALCRSCIGDAYLADEVRRQGVTRTCDYCGKWRKSYMIGEMADRVERVFEEHYQRTSDQPDDWQSMMLRDRESNYVWEREGEPTADAIMNSADMPQEAAEDIQAILEDRYDDFDAAAMGEETEFTRDAYYEAKSSGHGDWPLRWANFERTLKTEARFFSRLAVSHLSAIFDGIDQLMTRTGRALVVMAGPDTTITELHRARVFHTVDELKEALQSPAERLGSPPPRFAAAGRMNAQGISVFYGTTAPEVAVAEVRPPVGSLVIVAKFVLTRPLRLLDLTALAQIASGGSVYDPSLSSRLERANFLGSLEQRMTRPVMPNDEISDYLPTQAVADFLATEAQTTLDGIIFPSVQAEDGSTNVVLFQKASRVAHLELEEGATIEVETSSYDEDGPYPDYTIWIRLPPVSAPEDPKDEEDDALDWVFEPMQREEAPVDTREPALCLDLEGIHVHHVESVRYASHAFRVKKHENRRQDGEDPF